MGVRAAVGMRGTARASREWGFILGGILGAGFGKSAGCPTERLVEERDVSRVVASRPRRLEKQSARALGRSLPHPGPPGKVLPDLSRAHPHAGRRYLSFSEMSNQRQELLIHAGGCQQGGALPLRGHFGKV